MAEVIAPAPNPTLDIEIFPISSSTSKPPKTATPSVDTPIAPPSPRSRLQTVLVLTALSLTLFISALNTTIVATALPTICSRLHSASGYAWIGGAYLLANGASAPIWAKISDIWGRKPILLMAVGMYFATSILCAMARNMKMLVAGRALQGTAGGGLILLVNIILSDMFSLRHRSLYFGLLEVMWAIAAGVGPVLGGAFAQLVSWRWIFWIDLPVSGASFVLLLFFLDVHNPRTRFSDGAKAIDWAGSLSILGFVIMLLLGLDFGGVTLPWDSPTVICLIVFGSLLSVAFALSELKLAQHPLMPLGLFANKSNVACLLVTFTQSFAVLANEYYLPLFFQSVRGASPVHSGVLLLPITVMAAVGSLTAGIIIYKTGQYLELIWTGMAIFTIGEGLLIKLNVESSLPILLIFQLITGFGAGLLFEPPLIALQAMTSQKDIATATGTLSFIRSLSTSLAAVVGGVIFQNGMDIQGPKLRAAGLSSQLLSDLSGRSAAANVEDVMSMLSEPMQRLVVKEAFAWSLRNIWILCTCVTFCGLLFGLFIKKTALSKEHIETKTGLTKDDQ